MRTGLRFAVLLVVVFATPAWAEDKTFEDTEFADANWTDIIFRDDAGTFTFTAAHQAAGGNPDAYYRITHQTTVSPNQVAVAHFQSGAVHDPAQDGAIESYDWRVDGKADSAGGGGGVGFGPVIRQGGVFFSAAGAVLTPAVGWSTVSRVNLTPADFISWDGNNSQPDFSAAGAPIEFGFFSSSGTSTTQLINGVARADNWNVTVRCATSAVTLQFERAPGVTQALWSEWTEAGFRVAAVDSGDGSFNHIDVFDADVADNDDELALHGTAGSNAEEAILTKIGGGTFDLNSLVVEGNVVATWEVVSSKGAVVTITAPGPVTFSASGWRDVSSVTIRSTVIPLPSGVIKIDDIRLDQPNFELPFFETGDLFLRSNQLVRTDANVAGLVEIGRCVLSGQSSVFDAEGRLYTDAADGIEIYDRNFQLLGQAPVGDPVSSRAQFVALRGNGQLFGANPLSPGPSRLFVFDVSDPTNPALSSIQDIPHSGGGFKSRGLAFDRNGRLWVCIKSSLVELELDAAGTIQSDQLYPISGVNPWHLAFQPSTGFLFLSAVGSNFVAVVDPSDPLTRIANITNVSDTFSSSPLGLAFDSAGNLFIGTPGTAEMVSIPAASLQSLSGDVTAASLGAVDHDFITSGAVKTFSFKPQGVSRDPFTIDGGNNIAILSQDQNSTSLTGAITSNPLAESLGTLWFFDGNIVSNTLTVNLSSVGPLPVGDHTFTLQVEGCMLTVHDTVVVTVNNSPPTAAPAGDCITPTAGFVELGGQVADHDGDLLMYEWRKGTTVLASGTIATVLGGTPVTLPTHSIVASVLGQGIHMVDLAVDDGVNMEVLATIKVDVNDTTAPTCGPEPSTTILWPPNHQMVDVTIVVNAADDSGGPVTIAVAVAVSDAGSNGDNTDPDYVIVDDGNTDGVIDLQLRAERAGNGDGRTYTVTITVTDLAGNSATCEVEITAPHSKGNGNQ